MVCTKVLPELSPVNAILRPLLSGIQGELPTIVLLQNGLGIEQPLRDEFPEAAIISCCTWIGAHFIVRRAIVEHGSFERIDMGVFTQERKQTPEEKAAWLASDRGKRETSILADFARYVKEGGGDAVEKEEIQISRWHKNMW